MRTLYLTQHLYTAYTVRQHSDSQNGNIMAQKSYLPMKKLALDADWP